MDKILEEIIQSILTVTQRDYFVDSLEVLNNSLFNTHQNIFEVTSLTLSLPQSDMLVRMYHSENLLDGDKDRCHELIAMLNKKIKEIEVIEMRIAYNMSEADVKDIRNWFFYQYKRNVFLNMIVDPALLAGVVIYRKGIFKDYSVATYIDHYGRV